MHALTKSDDGMLAAAALPSLVEQVLAGLEAPLGDAPPAAADVLPHVAEAFSAEPFDFTNTGF